MHTRLTPERESPYRQRRGKIAYRSRLTVEVKVDPNGWHDQHRGGWSAGH